MAWDDLGELERRLQLAIQRFDWEAADEVCRNIIDRLPGETSPFPAQTARGLLQALRRKRRFAAMGLLAEAFLESGLRTAQIRRQYGQALIDQGMLSGGSSGSPVFDQVGWEVVGLHHAGRLKMPKLNGPAGESYEANEGIAILAIQQNTRSLP